MELISIACCVVFLLCLVAMPVIDYVGGRVCMPLSVPPLFPAEIVPLAIALLAGVCLLGALVWSFVVHRDQGWTVGALAIVIGAGAAYWCGARYLRGFLYGLRHRFVSKVGYGQMRQFAEEISQPNALASLDGTLRKPGKFHPLSTEQTKQWDALVSRYPFLSWNEGTCAVFVFDGKVTLTWGSPLVGHWGFQVAPGGEVIDLDPNRARFLRVAKDIQFVHYYD